MAQERLEEKQNPLFYTHLVLPDGLSCKWVYAPTLTDEITLKSTGERLVERVVYNGDEVRICSDDTHKIESLGMFLQGQHPEVKVNWGGTNYFEYDLSAHPLRENLNWKNYQKSYVFYRIEPQHNASEFRAVRSLMDGSFDLKDNKVFDKAIQNRQNNFYIVGDINSGKFVGSFVLVYMPALEEIQLHSVAGRSSDPRVSQQKGKLPIIMSAVLRAIDDDYPQQIPFGIAKNELLQCDGIKRLTFSSRGAAQLYKNLGFEESVRDGLVIKRK